MCTCDSVLDSISLMCVTVVHLTDVCMTVVHLTDVCMTVVHLIDVCDCSASH